MRTILGFVVPSALSFDEINKADKLIPIFDVVVCIELEIHLMVLPSITGRCTRQRDE